MDRCPLPSPDPRPAERARAWFERGGARSKGKARDTVGRSIFGESLATLLSVGVPLVLVVTVGVKLRRRRLFAYFRVIDDRTKQPLAGAEVSRVARRRSRIIGTLDAKGEFRGVFGHNLGAFVVSAPGIVSGLIGTEWGIEYGRFPDAPYVCTLRLGRIAARR